MAIFQAPMASQPMIQPGANVTVGFADEEVTIEITDDGTTEPVNRAQDCGHGLAGMRERVAVFGGELCAGPRPGGGFAVQATLPLADVLRRDAALS